MRAYLMNFISLRLYINSVKIIKVRGLNYAEQRSVCVWDVGPCSTLRMSRQTQNHKLPGVYATKLTCTNVTLPTSYFTCNYGLFPIRNARIYTYKGHREKDREG